jgi:1,4-dihydroxy-2-naphthoyl-CoA hydrolase
MQVSRMSESTAAPVWFRPYSVEEMNALNEDTLASCLGMRITAIGADHVSGSMPVDHRTVQPYGLLHGGASIALAETLGSLAAAMTVDGDSKLVVGQEINANHLRGVRKGQVTGTARPVHLGSRSQVWSIEIVDEAGKLVCISRLTMAVLDKPAQRPA